ncbi:MAG: hypothetical protein JXQ97_14025 [Natronospirillum sp.]
MHHPTGDRPNKWFEQVLKMRVRRHARHVPGQTSTQAPVWMPVWIVAFFFVSLVLAAVGNLLL